MILIYHPLAEQEIVEAAEFYESRRRGLGSSFIDQVDEAARRISSDPMCWPEIEAQIRRVMLKRFPFGIYFRVTDEAIRVLTVKHHRRHPGYGLRRMEEKWPNA